MPLQLNIASIKQEPKSSNFDTKLNGEKRMENDPGSSICRLSHNFQMNWEVGFEVIIASCHHNFMFQRQNMVWLVGAKYCG